MVSRLCEFGYGEATQPRETPPRRYPWFLDNGAFLAWRKGVEFDAEAFMRAVLTAYPSRPDFVVVPDVVGDSVATLEQAARWLPKLAGLAPLYVAAQDGVTRAQLERLLYLVPRQPKGCLLVDR